MNEITLKEMIRGFTILFTNTKPIYHYDVTLAEMLSK